MSDDTIRITKIKYSEKAGKTAINYTRTREGHVDELFLSSDEAPAPEFLEALKALILPVCNILELADVDFEKRIVPYGVTFHYDKNDVMGAIVSSKLILPGYVMSTVINTPMLKCQPDEAAEGCFFSETMTKLLWNLARQAHKYIGGYRAQVTLFDDVGNSADADLLESPDDGRQINNEIPPASELDAAQVINFPQNSVI